MKSVTKEEFFKFINSYPRKLSFDVTGICEPPFASYSDFTLGKYPKSIIGSYFLNDFLKNEGEHNFRIIDEHIDEEADVHNPDWKWENINEI